VRSWIRRWPFLFGGILIAPIAVGFGIISGGAGHGNYVTARCILPFACALLGDYACAGIVVTAAALLQWPVYGFLIDRASSKFVMMCSVVAVHGALCWWLFTKGSERFQ
jgi:hypothetical protein